MESGIMNQRENVFHSERRILRERTKETLQQRERERTTEKKNTNESELNASKTQENENKWKKEEKLKQ